MEYLKLFFCARVHKGRLAITGTHTHIDLRKSSLILSHIWDSIHPSVRRIDGKGATECEQGKKTELGIRHTKWLCEEWLSYLLGLGRDADAEGAEKDCRGLFTPMRN